MMKEINRRLRYIASAAAFFAVAVLPLQAQRAELEKVIHDRAELTKSLAETYAARNAVVRERDEGIALQARMKENHRVQLATVTEERDRLIEERDRALPIREVAWDELKPCGVGIAEPIGQKKERTEKDEPSQRTPPNHLIGMND